MRMRLMALLCVLAWPLVALAQPLADRIPADAMVYFGSAGLNNMGPGYDQSRLKAVLESSQLPQFIEQLAPALKKIASEEPGAAEFMEKFAPLYEALWRHPTAFFFCGVEFPDNGEPFPRLGFIMQAGPDADKLFASVQSLVKMAKDEGAPFPFEAYREGTLIGLIIGYPQPAAALAGGGKPAITTNARFQAALAQVPKNPLSIGYVDAEGILALANTVFDKFGQADGSRDMWITVRDALGLPGLQRIAWGSGFDQKDWTTQLFIAAPGPRVGLLKVLDAQPLRPEALKAVPSSATFVGVFNLDLAALLKEIRQVAGKIDPNATQQIDQTLAMVQQQFGINLEADFFEAVGPEWTLYSDPASTGRGLLGFVALNPLRKPDAAEKTLNQAEKIVAGMIEQNMRGAEFRIRIAQSKVGDMTVHYVPLPAIAPSWTIRNGVWYAGLYPQMVVAAANAQTGKSILDNPAYQAVAQRLTGGKKPTSIVYIDLPETAADGYTSALLIAQFMIGSYDMLGADSPPLVIPTLPQLKQHLAPAGLATWSDANGFYLKAITPFPGAALLSSNSSGAAVVAPAALGVSIILPAMNATKERANRVRSASNLRQIGQGVMLYDNDFKRYPATIGLLVTQCDLSPQVFLTPWTQNALPRFADIKEAAAWADANSEYIYLGAAMNRQMPADRVLAYEKPEVGTGEGINVLFNDGHVEWMTIPQAMQLIEKQKQPQPAPRNRR